VSDRAARSLLRPLIATVLCAAWTAALTYGTIIDAAVATPRRTPGLRAWASPHAELAHHFAAVLDEARQAPDRADER
jgi:hypothetical protein